MIGFGLKQTGKGIYVYRDHKYQQWTIYESSTPGDKWQARTSNYDVSILYAWSLEQLVRDIDAHVASHTFYFSRVDAEGLAMVGILGCLGGGAIAATAALFGFPRVAKLGGVKAAIGLGVAVTGVTLADRIKTRRLKAQSAVDLKS